jgi:hypothetical protein
MQDSRNDLQARLDVGYAEALAGANFSTEHRTTLSLPQLMWVSQEYLDAPVRVMFLGKETNGWIGKLRLDSYFDGRCTLENLHERYRDYLDESRSRGAFTQTLAHTAKRLTGGRRQAIAYGNLLKMDWDQGSTSHRNSLHYAEELREVSRKIIRLEVEVMKPDVFVFACGFSHASFVSSALGAFDDVHQHVPRGLHEFKLAGVPAFLLRHPQARASKKSAKLARFLKSRIYYDRAIDRIKELFPETSVGICPPLPPTKLAPPATYD